MPVSALFNVCEPFIKFALTLNKIDELIFMFCFGGIKRIPEIRSLGGKNRRQCHFISHKSHTVCTGIERVLQINFHEKKIRRLLWNNVSLLGGCDL
jgi:hypothetical protein